MDMHFFSHWKHVFKLDPDQTLSDEQLELICMSGRCNYCRWLYWCDFENTVDLWLVFAVIVWIVY